MKIQANKRLRADTFQELYEESERLDKLTRDISKKLNEIRDKGPKGPMGLTPDEVKNDPEFRKLKKKYDVAFAKLQKVNQFLMRNFKKEMAEAHRKRRGY